ncbi:UspA domain-containing protein [Bordetella sputigena]|uniref:universal stress protein n=1 Tax=Bordetella sputigena TaxID=1416810 RepID=UPI0039EE0E31
MSCILVPIDGSDNALRALNYVVRHIKMYEPLTLHLLNVQIPVISGSVRLFVDQDTIRRYHQEEGESMLAKAKALLDEAHVPYEAHIKVGHIAETIAAAAEQHKCDQIVMGSRGLGTTAGLWLGSVTTKTLHLAQVPVTIVK